MIRACCIARVQDSSSQTIWLVQVAGWGYLRSCAPRLAAASLNRWTTAAWVENCEKYATLVWVDAARTRWNLPLIT